MFGSNQPKPEKQTKSFANKGNAGKTIILIIVVAILVVLVNSSYYTIQEEEQAVVCTFGAPKAVTTPGLHFKIPFIQTVTKINTTIKGFTIGYSQEGENMTAYDDAMMITSDYNFINVDFYAAYRVTDPVKALYASEDPVEILKNIAQNCIRTTIASYTVDSVLTTGKNEIQANITQMILEKLESYDIGIQLINITIQDAEPPTAAVSNAFKEVETAKQGKETAINNANKYRNEQIPKAEAESDEILQSAEAQKQKRINEANGQVARFNSMYEEYVKYPEVTKKRMFYEAMESVLPDIKVIIESSDASTSTVLPLDSFVGENSSSINSTNRNSQNDRTDSENTTGEEE
ncbi:MAG: FtsH protease activity modulator HflK [Lachnospiraceae bacterium]|nr:FtsH protease activity modulator HflK [Lachnospiraceae bacterium]